LSPSPPPAPIPVAAEGQQAATPPEPSGPTPEQTAIIADLHWLIHQGHVIEFANGVLECAKKPVPKPPKPPKAQNQETAAATPQESASAGGGEPEAGVAAVPEPIVSDTSVSGEATGSESHPGTDILSSAQQESHSESASQTEAERPAAEQRPSGNSPIALSQNPVDAPATPIGSPS